MAILGNTTAASLELYNALPISSGGTGGKTAAEARKNLGITDANNKDIYVKRAGDTMSGCLVMDGITSGNWNEGIRINRATSGWATLVIGGAAGSTEGTGNSVWSMHRNTSGNFVLAHNGSEITNHYGLLFTTDGALTLNTTNVQIGSGATIGGATKINGQLWVNCDNDSKAGTSETGAIIVGAKTSGHLSIDDNEIMAKTDGTTAGILYLNNDGGLVQIGSGGLTTSGKVFSTSTADYGSNEDNRLTTKAYVDAKVAAGVTYKGVATTTPTSPEDGDMYLVGAAPSAGRGSGWPSGADTGDAIIYYKAGTRWDVINAIDDTDSYWKFKAGNTTGSAPGKGTVFTFAGSGVTPSLSNNTLTYTHDDPGTGTDLAATNSDSGTLTRGSSYVVTGVTITKDDKGHVTGISETRSQIPSSDNTDTKVTSVGNHYTPSADDGAALSASASGATAAWSIDVVKGITLARDAKGHVTGVSVTPGKIPAKPGWSDITDKPNRAGSSSDGGAATSANKVNSSLTIKLNGTTQGAWNGSSDKMLDITPSSIGAATSSHTHNYAAASHTHDDRYYTETETDTKLGKKLGAANANGYDGMARIDGNTTDWIRTTSNGIIPYQSGGSTNGHSGLGTSSWYFETAYVQKVYNTENHIGSCTLVYDATNKCLNFNFV